MGERRVGKWMNGDMPAIQRFTFVIPYSYLGHFTSITLLTLTPRGYRILSC